jgi:hypothetical protein
MKHKEFRSRAGVPAGSDAPDVPEHGSQVPEDLI